MTRTRPSPRRPCAGWAAPVAASVAALLLGAAGSLGAQPTAPAGAASAGAASARDDSAAAAAYDTAAFRRAVRRYADLLRLPGLAVAVARDGRVLYRQHEGYADVARRRPVAADHVFELASVTKTFTAVLLMQYAREGRASLDDYVLDYPFLRLGHPPAAVDPNARLRHVLGHTSEGAPPGSTFVYNGRRYNFVYGVFERVTADTVVPRAYTGELVRRIIRPLGLASTFAGLGAEERAALGPRVVRGYRFDDAARAFVEVPPPAGSTDAFPSAGMLSTVDDLVAYSAALDRHALLDRAGYAAMTAPAVGRGGRALPYGVGWFTQRAAGADLHWAYGYGGADAALLIRVPRERLTFVLLANSGFPSEAAELGDGDVRRSPFALAFLRHFVLGSPALGAAAAGDTAAGPPVVLPVSRPARRPDALAAESLYTEALVRAFVEAKLGPRTGEPARLLGRLYETDPGRFDRPEPTLLRLLADLAAAGPARPDPAVGRAARRAIRAYEAASAASGDLHPVMHAAVARYYLAAGDTARAVRSLHALADAPGFDEDAAKADAAVTLGRYYLRRRDVARGRRYLWRAAVARRQAGAPPGAVTEVVDELRRPAAH